MWFNQIKTTVLIASLMGVLMFFGGILGGYEGMLMAFVIAIVFNGIAYFYSDKIVLNMYGAKPLDKEKYKKIYHMIDELSKKNNMPMPKLWLINSDMANAFATGRNPRHASVAVTTGILDILDERELRGVLAHEISHVVNRDILISSVAATIAMAIGILANFAQNMAFWGTMSTDRERRGPNPIVLLLVAVLMPIAASLIQLAISRSREYQADESGADVCHDPLALASALKKLEEHTKYSHLNKNDTAKATTAHLFIVNPFLPNGITTLFMTHPPVAKRIARLETIHQEQTRNLR